MTHLDPKLSSRQLTFTVPEAAVVLGISKSTAYEAAQRGELPVLRFGRRLVVTRTTLENLLGLGEESPKSRALGRSRPRRTHWMRLPDRITTERLSSAPSRWSSTP